MKLVVATSTTHRIGGVETYLSDIIPALIDLGHEVAVVCERETAVEAGRDSILARATGVEVLSLARLRSNDALVRAAREWRPDLVYAHGMDDPELEDAIERLAPTVFFVHVYHGTCIAGAKRFAFPTLRPCSRTFGAACLALYYPRRCGGLSPLTMWQMFLQQRRRLQILRRCDAVITHSFHMYSEYAKHGIDLSRLHRFVYYSPDEPPVADASAARVVPLPVFSTELSARPLDSESLTITFTGRMDLNKGIHLLIDASPIAARLLNRKLTVNLVGDGPTRAKLQRQAARVQVAHASHVSFEFPGWLSRQRVGEYLQKTDLVVVPSAWPEPFGLVGPEAGHHGIPVAAFDVGGIGSWLVDGVNGYLAAADPPSAGSLAVAMTRCLRDDATYARLRQGAVEMSQRFSRGSHLQELLALFDKVLNDRRSGARKSESLVGAAS